MKVLQEARTPQGIEIQIEDWTQDYSCFNTFYIAAYPIAKNTSKYGWIRGGKNFRLGISREWKSNEEVYTAFNELVNGTKKLEDFADRFWNGEKDQWYLGMDVENNDY